MCGCSWFHKCKVHHLSYSHLVSQALFDADNAVYSLVFLSLQSIGVISRKYSFSFAHNANSLVLHASTVSGICEHWWLYKGMSKRRFTLIFSHILPRRRESQICLKSNTARRASEETDLDFSQQEIHPSEQVEHNKSA